MNLKPRILVAALFILSLVVVFSSAAPSHVSAQDAPDPQLDVWLYSGTVGVRTTATDTPTVRVLDPSGKLRLEVTPTSPRPADGHWVVTMRRPEDGAVAIIRPGDLIEVDLSGRTTKATVPEMHATADVELDAVSGRVPAGSPALLLQIRRDATWFDTPSDPDGEVHAVGQDGTFDVAVPQGFDVRPGTFGEVATVDAAGHIYVVTFGVPAATLIMSETAGTTYYYATGRCNPQHVPRIAVLSQQGFEVFRSGPASWVGAGVFAVALVDDGDPLAGAFLPEPGQQLVLLMDDDRAFAEPIPPHSASIGRRPASVGGMAPPGSRVAVAMRPALGADTVSTVTTADEGGRYVAPYPGIEATMDASAQILAYAGGSAAYVAIGGLVAQDVTLYGKEITGIVAGRGHATAELWRQGTVVARRETHIDPVGRIDVALLSDDGSAVAIQPADRLRLRPVLGDQLELDVPMLTASVDGGARILRGSAAPGAEVAAQVFTIEASLFDPEPFEQPHASLEGTAAADGAYEIDCAATDCQPMRYGTVSVDEGTATFTLHWIGQPSVGVGATLSTVVARATSGLPVTIHSVSRSGAQQLLWRGVVHPAATNFPRHQADLRETYPEGLSQGDRLKVAVGERAYDVEVPPFTWQADVVANAVSGTAPPLSAVIVVAENYGDTSRPGAAFAQTLAAQSGRWNATFGGFNLKPGDDLTLYVPNEDHFVWWVESAVRGEEPTPDPTATPTMQPSATPPPIASATPGSRGFGEAYLPMVVRIGR